MLVLNDMAADARVDREAAALAAAGHDLSVLALRAPNAPDRERRSGYTIRRIADYTTATWRQPWRKLRQSQRRKAAFVKTALSLEPEVVHAHDTDTLAIAALVADVRHVPLVYDAHELYTDMIAEFGAGGSWPVQAYWKHIERRHVPRATAVVTVSEGLADELARRFGVSPVVLRNVPSLEPIVRSSRLRDDLGVGPDVTVVLYQGVLIGGRGLARLASAMREVPGAVLAIQGSGPEEAAIRAAAGEAGVADRVRLMGRMHSGDLHEYACGADVGVVIYEHTTLNNYLAGPNKLYAYLMAGLPIAGSDFPGIREVVSEGEIGALFDPADEASIAAALAGLLGDAERRADMGARARQLAETKYNWNQEK
ncbi:MAG TPA: glycosyltransferase family 4 protein, partial [Coriobacteriia bacterium]|nr:glycosyltransferase family 4 protein [Coriobacteriia bacterium]